MWIRIISAIKTLLIVGGITAWVWLYAESENVKTREIDLTLELVSPPGREMVISPQESTAIHVRIRCANSMWTQVQRRLQSRTLTYPVLPSTASAPANHTLDLREWLTRQSPLAMRGLNIDEVEPKRISFQAEPLETINLPVQVESPGATTLSLNPQEVQVKGPASIMASLANIHALARVDPALIKSIDSQQSVSVAVPVMLPPLTDMRHVTIRPGVTTVTITAQERNATLILPSVPVHLLLPPGETTRYSVQVHEDQQVLREVALSGPELEIQQLTRGQVRLLAVLALTADDLETSVGRSDNAAPVAFFNLPSGVSVDSTLPSVAYTVTRKP